MKKAFTFIEMIFVIIIVAIISSVALTRFGYENKEELQFATDQIIRDIRYTQHLALIDDKFTPSPDPKDGDGDTDLNDEIKASRMWYKKNWQIFFGYRTIGGTRHYLYTIFSDSPSDTTDNQFNGTPTESEVAIDPQNGEYLSFHSNITPSNEKLDLTQNYNISDIDFDNNCGSGGSRILFDNLGRPYNGFNTGTTTNIPYKDNYSINRRCLITVTHDSGLSNLICIEPISGYIHQVKSSQECS